jgi:hypothetical protein
MEKCVWLQAHSFRQDSIYAALFFVTRRNNFKQDEADSDILSDISGYRSWENYTTVTNKHECQFFARDVVAFIFGVTADGKRE